MYKHTTRSVRLNTIEVALRGAYGLLILYMYLELHSD